MDALKDLSEGARHQIEVRINNLTEAIEDKWDIVHDLMEGQENETAAEGKLNVMYVKVVVTTLVYIGIWRGVAVNMAVK